MTKLLTAKAAIDPAPQEASGTPRGQGAEEMQAAPWEPVAGKDGGLGRCSSSLLPLPIPCPVHLPLTF